MSTNLNTNLNTNLKNEILLKLKSWYTSTNPTDQQLEDLTKGRIEIDGYKFKQSTEGSSDELIIINAITNDGQKIKIADLGRIESYEEFYDKIRDAIKKIKLPQTGGKKINKKTSKKVKKISKKSLKTIKGGKKTSKKVSKAKKGSKKISKKTSKKNNSKVKK